MKFVTLFPDASAPLADQDCASLTADSRKAGPDTVFVAVPGVKADGRGYIADAVARGCRIIAAQGPRPDDRRPAGVLECARDDLARRGRAASRRA